MMEQGYQIGEGFVPGAHVSIGRLKVVTTQTVHDPMGHLVGDDVHRQACEHQLTG